MPNFAGMLAACVPGRLRSLALPRNSIGMRLLARVLFFGACVTLILTAIQLYLEYRRDVADVELRLNQIGGTYLDSLAEGLWNFDEKQLRLQLEGILRLPDIRGVEVREADGSSNPPFVKLSRDPQNPTFAREYPLHYSVQGQDRAIGTLRVEATLAGIYRRLANTASIILVTQAVTIFLVSLFILYFFHHLVTRHLSAIAADVDRHRMNDSPLELHLRRPAPRHEDELQRVVTAFNALSSKLHVAHRDRAKREAKIRRLVDANIIGIFIWDFDGRIIEANDAFLQMVGYDREDLVAGRIRWMDLTPPEWRNQDAAAIEEVEKTGISPPSEKEYFRKDGSRVPILRGAATLEEGGNQGVAFVLDLTELKRTEKALRESEEQWKAVFENNPVMYFMVDAAGIIVSVNPFGAEQLGYRIDELIGRPVQNVFHQADRDTVRRNAAACFEHLGQAMSWELRKVRKNGDVIWVRETARATLINERPVLLIVCEDITEGKRAAETLRTVQTELAHANRVAALGQLTASIAHEVNQPLGAMVNNAQAALHFLDRRPPDLEEVREALASIMEGGHRAADVVSRIRALLKKAPPRTESFDMNEAIREVIVITRAEAAKNGIAVEARFAEGLPLVQGDRVQLQQVILNLIINAIEAMSGAGEAPRELRIETATSDSGSVAVAVQDSGPGLAPENPDRAFEAFYTTKPQGLGIGLSICRSIVEAHGGTLGVAANVPHGATFEFTVPARGDDS